jgi:selenoprotein W-related protein
MTTHHIEITYCTQCRWMLRAAWIAQELLITFESDLSRVSLVPATGGIFCIHLDGQLIFSRQQAGHFPELKLIKQLIRDVIDPQRSLGHSDRPQD